MPIVHAALSDAPVDAEALEQLVAGPHDGAVARFVGRVRDHDPEASGEVVELHYSAHPDAPRLVAGIAGRALAASDPNDQTSVAVVHRTGTLGVGDIALVVVAASAHRGPAFAVCQAVVEAVKAELPVWKKQVERDGRHAWSGLPGAGA